MRARRCMTDRSNSLLGDVSTKLADDSYDANDVLIERGQLFRWHPQLQVFASTDLVYLELGNVLGIDFERSHVSRATITHVPALGDLRSVLLVQHGIEDRLFG